MTFNEFIEKYKKNEYLSEGVYASFDGYSIILKTERENGWHWIALEPYVFEALLHYKDKIFEDSGNIK
jgi:hypothetical protein